MFVIIENSLEKEKNIFTPVENRNIKDNKKCNM